MNFFLYKGLKKPLVFFGLKNNNIYYALGFLLGGFILSAVFSNIIGFFGMFIGIGMGGLGVWWIIKQQDKNGIYKKTKNHDELHIFPKNLKIKKRKNEN